MLVFPSSHPPSLLHGSFRDLQTELTRTNAVKSFRISLVIAEIPPVILVHVPARGGEEQPLPSQSSGAAVPVGRCQIQGLGPFLLIGEGKLATLTRGTRLFLAAPLKVKGCLQVQTWLKVGVKVRARHSFMIELEAAEPVCICSFVICSSQTEVCVCVF